MIKSSIINRNTGKSIDTYGVGQSFGKFAVEFCNQHNIDIDDFYKAIKQESSMFINGMADGIGSNRQFQKEWDQLD